MLSQLVMLLLVVQFLTILMAQASPLMPPSTPLDKRWCYARNCRPAHKRIDEDAQNDKRWHYDDAGLINIDVVKETKIEVLRNTHTCCEAMKSDKEA